MPKMGQKVFTKNVPTVLKLQFMFQDKKFSGCGRDCLFFLKSNTSQTKTVTVYGLASRILRMHAKLLATGLQTIKSLEQNPGRRPVLFLSYRDFIAGISSHVLEGIAPAPSISSTFILNKCGRFCSAIFCSRRQEPSLFLVNRVKQFFSVSLGQIPWVQ